MIPRQFFHQPAIELAQSLIGKVLRHRVQGQWLSARIIETEAYETSEKGSHSSLGISPSRKAMFMPPGTIYMYYARGADSLNFSAQGDGDAVLIKSAYPVVDHRSPERSLHTMQRLNPANNGIRSIEKLCAGQTLLCKSLGLKVKDWNGATLIKNRFEVEDDGYAATELIQCRRLGIPAGRDDHLLYRFVDASFCQHSTQNPLTKRGWKEGTNYLRVRR